MVIKCMKPKTGHKGFTLVELMIVVAIMGILAAISISVYSNFRKQGYVTIVNSDCKNAFTASASFLSETPSAIVVTLLNMTDSGYVASNGITTVGSNIVAADYTITSTGLAVWGLSDTDASITALSVWDSADP